MSSHLTSKELLHYVDGEFPNGRKRQITEHLESCWACRRELERLERDIDTILDAQEREFFPSVAAPPRAWPGVDQLIGSGSPRSFFLRKPAGILRLATPSPLRLTFVIAALICLTVAGVWLFPERLSASEVLQRVRTADQKRIAPNADQVVRQRVRVDETDRRTRAKRSGEFESWKAGQRTIWRVSDHSIGQDLEERYHRQGIEADLPLASGTYSKWFERTSATGNASRHNGEIEIAAEGDVSADVESVRLRVREADWHVENLEITFADATFDVTEIDLAVLGKEEVAPAIMAALNPAPPTVAVYTPTIREVVPPAPSVSTPAFDLSEIELDVRARLHEIGADLREPIAVKVQGPDVEILAWGASVDRKRQLAELFGSRPHIKLQMDEPLGPARVSETPVTILPSTRPKDRQDDRMTKWFGSADAQESYTRSVLSLNGTILSRLFALRSLAERWPPDAESGLSEKGRTQLHAIARDHTFALGKEVPELSAQLAPLFSQFCGPRFESTPDPPLPEDWQAVGSGALESAKSLDRLLRGLLTTSSDPLSLDTGCAEVRATASMLDRSVRALSAKF